MQRRQRMNRRRSQTRQAPRLIEQLETRHALAVSFAAGAWTIVGDANTALPDDKNPSPLLAPSWDKRHPKPRFTLMLAKLVRLVVGEFSTMYRQLQAAVDALPMVAVIGPSHPPSPR